MTTTTQDILERLQYFEHAPLTCVCGEAEGTQYATSDRHGIDTMLRVCSVCGLVRTDPAPDDASLSRFYANDYRALFDDGGVEARWTAQVETGRALLRGLDGLIAPGSYVIDYGCGVGGMLQPFSEAGHRVLGIEPGEYAARGRELLGPCIVDDSSGVADGSADVVIAMHTIEHRRDLGAALADHRRLLKPGGLLVCEVPTLEAIGPHYANLRAYLQIPHVWHFSTRALVRVMSHAGFNVTHMIDGRCVIAQKLDNVFALGVSAHEIAETNHILRVLTDSVPPEETPPPSTLAEFARWFEGAPLDDLRITEDELRDQFREIDAMRQRLMAAVQDLALRMQERAGSKVNAMDHDVIAAAEHGAYMAAAQEANDVLTVARAELMIGGGA